MIKRLFIYMVAVMSLVGCSDDIFDSPSGALPSDGKLTLSFNVPEMASPATRANEDDMKNLQMLVFSKGILEQVAPIENPATGKSVTVTIDEDLRRVGNLDFLFVSNSPVTFTEGEKYADIINLPVEDVIKDDYMVMTGKSDLQSLLKLNAVNMFRNATKITVRDKEKKEGVVVKDYPFEVYGTAKESPLTAGLSNTDASFSATGMPCSVAFKKDLRTGEEYYHPTNNTGTSLNSAYIIAKVPYKDKEYYYRLNLRDEEGEALDLLPNYYYEVVILDSPRSAGYATQEEAAKNPVSISEGWYIIHDHAPVIFNMVSDGTRELGVSHLIRNEQTEENTTADLYVKLYSKTDSSEEEDFYADNISFGSNWLHVNSITKVESGTYVGSNGSGTINEEENEDGTGDIVNKNDYNTPGTLYKVSVLFSKTGNTGLLESECNVNWKGLTREIPVEWNRTFNPDMLYKTVKLTMKEGETVKKSTDDYFTFIRGDYNDEGVQTVQPSVWGLSAEANNGESRDLGLHFPVQYGNPTLWTYEYEVELNDLGEGATYTWEYEFTGDDAVNGTVTLEVLNEGGSMTLTDMGPKFKLKRSGEGWSYGTGELVIKVGESTYPITLYHTGFFHKDYPEGTGKGIGLAKIAESTESREWTYYEVVSMGDAHWLDRNLGAHSAGMYVESSSGSAYHGNPDAAGGYYRVAGYVKHGKPDMEEAICPPGYTYPTQLDYNNMRSKADFFTGQVGSYYTAAYSADIYEKGTKRKTVYFPKSLYLDADNNRAGESRAGYYWTSSAASGTEKEEIGAWLKCFNLSGAATSFINGEVYCSSTSTAGNSTRTNEINGFAMPVRCIANGTGDVTPEATSFFVKGATHVFLYTQQGENRTPVTTWPGVPVGSYNTITKLFNVLYESAVNTPDNLYVIFNYKDENGKIHSMSKDLDNTLLAIFTETTSPKLLQGWKVKGDEAPNWNNYGGGTLTTQVIDTKDNDTGKTKYYWTCDFFIKKGGFGTTEGEISVPTYRLYWPEAYGRGANTTFWGINLFFGAEDTRDWDTSFLNKWYSENAYTLENGYYYVDIPMFDWPKSLNKLYIQGKTENDTYHDRQPFVLRTDFTQTSINDNGSYYCYTITDNGVKGNGEHVNGKGGCP